MTLYSMDTYCSWEFRKHRLLLVGCFKILRQGSQRNRADTLNGDIDLLKETVSFTCFSNTLSFAVLKELLDAHPHWQRSPLYCICHQLRCSSDIQKYSLFWACSSYSKTHQKSYRLQQKVLTQLTVDLSEIFINILQFKHNP